MGFLLENCTISPITQEIIDSYSKFDCGDEDLNSFFIKAWFVHPLNKTGCRFIVVDALNEAPALSYYEKNSFGYLFSSEEQEALSTNKSGELKTRLMYFDLVTIK